MKNKTLLVQANLLIGLVGLGIFLSSCVPYFKLSKSEFPQGKELDIKQLAVANQYLRSATIYDKYTTLAVFDVLWLSDSVRDSYVNINSQKTGKSQTSKDALLNRQLEENKHWVSFYVLADIRQLYNENMNEKNPLWSVYLDLGQDRKIEPESVKEVELDPEYRFFFGTKINSFKTPYLVQFPISGVDSKNYLIDCTVVKLVVSSVDKSCEFVWNLNDIQKSLANIAKSKKKVQKDEDFYWG